MTNATYRGYDGMRQWMAEIDDQFEDWQLSIERFGEGGRGRILVLGRVHMRGRASGLELDQPVGWLLGFKSSRIVEMRIFDDQDEALSAAGAERAHETG
jgi:ketosteroid isomerase-like protein